MIDYVSSLPIWAGCTLSILLTTVAGLAVYFVFRLFLARYPIEEIEDPIGSLFRVIGILVSLMLSLAFAEVVVGVRAVESAIQRETAAISDTFKALGQFDSDAARSTQMVLIEYTRAIADDDWSALAHDRLGDRTDALKAKLTDHVMQLQPSTPAQEKLWSSILTDVDTMSDARLTRLQGALAEPPVYIVVVFLGFLITMACFGAYRPRPPLLVLVSLYTMFVGLVLYMIVSMSDPFLGGLVIEPTSFDLLHQELSATPR
jgi:xanthosine utilization system XapX-like protein